MDPTALVLAPPEDQERYVTGLHLGERARRVAVKCGIDPSRVVIARSVEELSAAMPQLDGEPLVLIRASRQVVAPELIDPLDLDRPGARAAYDADKSYAGAAFCSGDQAAALLAALAEDFDAGDEAAVAEFSKVEVGARARHPAWTKEQLRAADTWQFELTHKSLDGFLPTFYQRPLARPFTRMFLRLPFTPNVISVVSSSFSLTGCFIAAYPSWSMHVLGLALLFFGNVIDACDGEVARLRHQASRAGAWLDAAGDDIARIALILALGFHVSANHPEWPVMWIMAGTIALTVTGMALIYWYCIFVIGSSSNQDYEAVLGVGGDVGVGEGGKSLKRWIGDAATTAARRVFIDPATLILALFSLTWLAFIGLAIGSVVSLAIILPAHIGIVQSRRAARASE